MVDECSDGGGRGGCFLAGTGLKTWAGVVGDAAGLCFEAASGYDGVFFSWGARP